MKRYSLIVITRFFYTTIMQVHIKTFGKLQELIKTGYISVDIDNTDDLIILLTREYPLLPKLLFRISVNNKIIQSKTVIKEGDEIALLPPFAGG